MAAADTDGATREASLESSVEAAHALALTVWDVPSAAGAGERFSLMVGVRCSSGCDLSSRELTLVDQHGAPACTVALGGNVWPGTEALYFARAEACAPLEAGSYAWEAKMDGWEGGAQHTAGSCVLTIGVAAAPECEVTVTATDRESGMPIANARVVMHPYRAVTGVDGIAKVKVAKGNYDVLVSGHRYLPFSASIEVGADVVTSAELEADRLNEEMYE